MLNHELCLPCMPCRLQMLPEGVANALRAGRTAPASTHGEVTILFSDIVGFTNIAALCSPMEICKLLDSLCKHKRTACMRPCSHAAVH